MHGPCVECLAKRIPWSDILKHGFFVIQKTRRCLFDWLGRPGEEKIIHKSIKLILFFILYFLFNFYKNYLFSIKIFIFYNYII